jgi:hypothetical protein
MNIALCFSGQVRSFRKTYRSFRRHILDQLSQHEVYLFAHFPQDESSNFAESVGFHDYISEKKEPVIEVQDIEGHEIFYRPWHRGHGLQSYLRQIRGIELANNLSKSYSTNHGINFDWAFRLRFDNLYRTDLENLASLDTSAIYIPAHDNWYGYNDRFGFGHPTLMDIYSDRLQPILEHASRGCKIHPETCLKEHLKSHFILVNHTKVVHHLLRYNSLWPAYFGEEYGDDPSFSPVDIRSKIGRLARNTIGEKASNKLIAITLSL